MTLKFQYLFIAIGGINAILPEMYQILYFNWFKSNVMVSE